jgi:hypothetical protein
MSDMSLQERYDDICSISGLSEDIVRRVLKASRQSLAKSARRGQRSTLPGICTIIPELKHKVELGGTKVTSYVKLKAVPSNALSSELDKLSKFEEIEDNKENCGEKKLNYISSPEFPSYNRGVRTNQISALM